MEIYQMTKQLEIVKLEGLKYNINTEQSNNKQVDY
jgi:hypothetical protein